MKEMRYSPLPRKSNCNENMAIWQTNSLKSQIVPPKKGAMFSRLYGIVGVSASLWELAQFLGLETEMGVSSCYNHGESMCRCCHRVTLFCGRFAGIIDAILAATILKYLCPAL